MQTDPGALLTATQADVRRIAAHFEANWAKDAVDLTDPTSGTWVDESAYLLRIGGKQTLKPPDDGMLLPAPGEPWSLNVTLDNPNGRFSPKRTDGALYALIGSGGASEGLFQTPVRAWTGFYYPNTSVLAVRDECTDTNGTSLPSHAVAPTNTPATSWQVHNGSWAIQSNKATLSSGGAGGRHPATVNPGVADCSLSVKAAGINGWFTGLAARVTDKDNAWLIVIKPSNNVFQIVELNAGVETVRATVSVTVSQGVEYTLTAQLSGSTITAQLNGANEISYGSATFLQTNTKHGIYQGNATGNTADDFEVYAPLVTTTTLSAAIANTTVTSVQFAAAVATGVVVRVDSEELLVVAGGTTATVRRAFNGTTAATHSNGATASRVAALTVEFTGVIHQPPQNPERSEVELRCLGREYLLQQNKQSSQVYQDQTAPELIGSFLGLLPASPTFAPVPAGQQTFDPGILPFPYGFLDDEDLWTQCCLVAAAEGGRFVFNKQGEAIYQNSQAWIGASSQWTFSADEAATIVPHNDFEQVFSDVVVRFAQRSVAPIQEVYRATRNIHIPPGASVTVEARFSYPVTSLVTPVGGAAPSDGSDDPRDYYAVGGNEDITSSVTITALAWGTNLWGQRAKLTLTNAHATLGADVVRLRLRGTPIVGSPEEEVRKTKTTTPSNLAKRDRIISGDQRTNWFIQSQAIAAMVADFLSDRLKRVREVYTIRAARGVPQLEVGDLVTLSYAKAFTSTITAHLIEKQWEIDFTNEQPKYTMTCRAVEATGLYQSSNYFLVGTSALNDGKVFFY